MASSNRSRAKPANSKARSSSPSLSDDGTMPDVSVKDTSNFKQGMHLSPQNAEQPQARHDVSRLSQDLEPMNLDDCHQKDDQEEQKPFSVEDLNPLGQHVKEASAAMGTLEALGLQNLDISIPRCIVLGQQSTGKSSVIEAISGIRTPRDTGMCTSCPLYITMQPSDNPNAPWSAKISLQRDYLPDTRTQAEVDAGPALQFPKWMPAQSSEHIRFAETNSQAELEHIIQRAQAANLSPFEKLASFQAGLPTRKDSKGSKFSPNLVRVDITEPGLPSLSFFDLPGLISQAGNEEEDYTVPLVKNLVAEYVKQPGSLILVTCDLGTDMANSTAAALAREHKAVDRCIGVLTKPDLLPRGTPDEGLSDILDGKRFKLGHEYFVVKNLDKKAILKGLSHHDARQLERNFFAKGRWITALRRFQPRFGTLNLQIYLSKQLAKQTFEGLPAMHDQISERLNGVNDELGRIPETPAHNAVRTISDILLSFTVAVRYEMEGEFQYNTWKNIWGSIQKAFNDSLETMKPTLTLRGDLDKGLFLSTLPGKSAAESILINSDNEDDVLGNTRTLETPPKKRKREEATPAPSPFKTPSKTPNRAAIGTPSRRSNYGRQATQTPSQQDAYMRPADFVNYRKTFKLDDVKSHLNQNECKVPGEIHPKVRESMMRSAFEKWDIPIELFFCSLKKELGIYMRTLFHESFQTCEGSELYRRAWSITEQLIELNLNEQKDTMAAESLKDELEGPYIFYQDHYRREKGIVREMFRQRREEARFRILVAEAKEYFKREILKEEQDKFRKDAKKKEVVADEPYAVEVDLVSDIKAYYNIAARRLHDSICMRVESKFFHRLRHDLRSELETSLGIYDNNQGSQIAQRLLAKSPEREKRRQELVAMRDALEKGLTCLKDLQSKYDGWNDHVNKDGFGNPATDSDPMEE